MTTSRITCDQYRREALKRKLERDVQKEACDYLFKIAPGRPLTVTDATRSFNVYGKQVTRVKPGWPDVTTMLPNGVMFAIECKRPVGGKLDPAQARTLKKIHEWGGVVCIARSVEDVADSLAIYAETNIRMRHKDALEIEKALHPKDRKPDGEYGF